MNVSDIKSAMDALVFTAEGEDRALTEDEATKYEALESDMLQARKTAEIAKRHQSYSLPVAESFPSVIRATPKGDAALDFAFDQYLRTGQPNGDLSQLYAQSEGTTTAGGYAVPDGFLSRIVEKRTAFGGLMNAAENITTANGIPLQWPSIVAPVYTQADIAAEHAATAAGADLVFAEVTLGAYKYTSAGTGNLPVKVSMELLQDASIDISGLVARKLGERIARKMAYDFCMGSGSGMPLGIAYGTAGTIEADLEAFADFIDLLHALDPAYRPGASWIMNDATLAITEKLLDGASGTSGRPLLTYGQGAEDSPSHGRLLGYPVIIDQAMPTMNTDDVIGIAFGNWKEAYIVRHVRDVQVLVNPYAAAGAGFVQYDAWARADGTVQNSAAYVTGEGV